MKPKSAASKSHAVNPRVGQSELDGEIGPLVNCHCQHCRRAHGAAFATTIWVERKSLRFTSGADGIREYRSGSGGVRSFCERCGTRLYNRGDSTPDFVALIAGSLDEDPDSPPVMHLNLESKARWYRILDDAPQHETLPPEVRRLLNESS